jgi:superfamily II RNA helicase
VLVSAPTGAGKTLVADYAIEHAFESGWRAVYTSPIKALSNQKYRDFRAEHGDQVGIMTGDVTINPDADLLIMTTEVFRNTLFDDPERLRDFRFVIHDEVHYIDDADRGTVWEESIIHAPPQMRLVCLSATIPNVDEFAGWIETVRHEEITVVRMHRRPVPLDHLVWVPDLGAVHLDEALPLLKQPLKLRRRMRRERRPTRLLDWLQSQKLLPALFFAFSRKECEALAVDNARRALLNGAERKAMSTLFHDLAQRFECKDTPALRRLRDLAANGVAYHHAGMLPVHKEIVERLFTSGMVRMLFATETFALGINMPARTVAFAGLRKFDGEKMDYMLCRSYGQMAGRAGRQGMDSHGLVVAGLDPKFDRADGVRRVLTHGAEPVRSRWNPDYSTVLSLYSHMGDRVVETYERSFAKYQRERRAKPKNVGKTSSEQRLLRARLGVLKRTGFIRDGEVTDLGAFTSRVNGYEILGGLWRHAGLLAELDERGIAILLLASVYEPRPDHATRPSRDRGVGDLATECVELMREFRLAEWESGIVDLTPLPDFALSSVMERWLDGHSLAGLDDVTSVGHGDVVRTLRLMLQFARQLRKALPKGEREIADKLSRVMDRVNRDEVDARRQLELGQDPLDGDEDDDEDGFGAGLDDAES